MTQPCQVKTWGGMMRDGDGAASEELVLDLSVASGVEGLEHLGRFQASALCKQGRRGSSASGKITRRPLGGSRSLPSLQPWGNISRGPSYGAASLT